MDLLILLIITIGFDAKEFSKGNGKGERYEQ